MQTNNCQMCKSGEGEHGNLLEVETQFRQKFVAYRYVAVILNSNSVYIPVHFKSQYPHSPIPLRCFPSLSTFVEHHGLFAVRADLSQVHP